MAEPASGTMDDAALARRVLALLDLTELGDGRDVAAAEALIDKALDASGAPAAICLWPEMVERAARRLGERPIRIVTVLNFPHGDESIDAVVTAAERALDAGADELDLVLPWRALLAGDAVGARAMVGEVRDVAGDDAVLKVILETGALPDAEAITRAAAIAIDAGADFLKTSTGKVPVGATPAAVAVLLDAIAGADHPVGLKISGGVRTLTEARSYLAQVEAAFGVGWATPERFRFGASSLHGALLAAIRGATDSKPVEGY